MSNKTLFFVQPYVWRHQKPAASGAMMFFSASEALKIGAQVARRRAGVVVMSQSYNAASDHLGRPVVLQIHGRVPEAWLDAKQAA